MAQRIAGAPAKTIKRRTRGILWQVRPPRIYSMSWIENSTCASRSSRIGGYGVPPAPAFSPHICGDWGRERSQGAAPAIRFAAIE